MERVLPGLDLHLVTGLEIRVEDIDLFPGPVPRIRCIKLIVNRHGGERRLSIDGDLDNGPVQAPYPVLLTHGKVDFMGGLPRIHLRVHHGDGLFVPDRDDDLLVAGNHDRRHQKDGQ